MKMKMKPALFCLAESWAVGVSVFSAFKTFAPIIVLYPGIAIDAVYQLLSLVKFGFELGIIST